MTPRHTPLHAEHQALGATFTDFGGWEMPLRYGSELAEHHAVRDAAGLFDLSHMGEVEVRGPDAGIALNTALVGDLAAVRVGKAKYTLIVNEQGGIIDDLIVYRLADDRFLVVPNAGNADTVATELQRRAQGFAVTVTDVSAETSLIAVQGPRSVAILHDLVPDGSRALISDLPVYAAVEAEIGGAPVLLARTGYTGEDGFELFVDSGAAVELWRRVRDAGLAHGLVAAGLAARDSLRLEAGMPLYGNELSLETTPVAAGLGGVVSLRKSEAFVGRAALERASEEAPARVLVGLRGSGRRAARGGYAVHEIEGAGRAIGTITSGQPSPTLGYPIALASIDPAWSEPGTALEVDLRGRREPFEVVALPFLRRR